MAMTPRISKLVFTSHIIFSVSWLGAVTVFLALAITGLATRNMQLAHSTYIAMEVSTLFVIVPFCLASFFTGLLQALGTKWGLFKYYWIVVKLFLTLAMTALLLLHLQPISYLAGVAAESSVSNTSQAVLVIDLIKKAGAAILVLLAVTTISVYKPWGKIQLGQNSNNQFIKMQDNGKKLKKSWTLYVLTGVMVLVLIFIIIHLFGSGMHGH